jgi:hypothetical protein
MVLFYGLSICLFKIYLKFIYDKLYLKFKKKQNKKLCKKERERERERERAPIASRVFF